MRRGYIIDVKEIFQIAFDNNRNKGLDSNREESEYQRISKLRRDVISDLYKLQRLERALIDVERSIQDLQLAKEDPPNPYNRPRRFHGRHRDNGEHHDEGDDRDSDDDVSSKPPGGNLYEDDVDWGSRKK